MVAVKLKRRGRFHFNKEEARRSISRKTEQGAHFGVQIMYLLEFQFEILS